MGVALQSSAYLSSNRSNSKVPSIFHFMFSAKNCSDIFTAFSLSIPSDIF